MTRPRVAAVLLCLQIVPLVLFPASVYSPKTQQWWLPTLLVLLTVISLIQLLVRRSSAPWPWYMLGFCQGFNIISRLMMLMPHATVIVDGEQRLATAYVVLTLVAMALSAGALWHVELPEVRTRMPAGGRPAGAS